MAPGHRVASVKREGTKDGSNAEGVAHDPRHPIVSHAGAELIPKQRPQGCRRLQQGARR